MKCSRLSEDVPARAIFVRLSSLGPNSIGETTASGTVNQYVG